MHGETVKIISVCVCILAPVIRHANGMRRIISSTVSYPNLPYISHYLMKGTIVLNMKYVF